MSKPTIENMLSEMMTEPTPDARFVAELERTLHAPKQTFWQRIQQTLFPPRRRLATIGFAIMLTMFLSVALIEPQKIMAEIQQFFGYVPGVGFTDLDGTRILAKPIRQTRDGITLVVEQVIADDEMTTVVITTENLPTITNRDKLPDGGLPILELPDGTQLNMTGYGLSYGFGTFEYEVVPEDVHQLKLFLPRLPKVPDDFAPRNWSVPIHLAATSAENFTDLYSTPYKPVAEIATNETVSVEVLEVSHSAEMTAILFEMKLLGDLAGQVEPYSFRTSFGGSYLTDKNGTRYDATLMPNSASAVQIVVENGSQPPTDTVRVEVTFPAEAGSAEMLTLHLEQVMYTVAESGSFSIDLGNTPQVGDTFAVDETFTLLNAPLSITGARLESLSGICIDDCPPETFLLVSLQDATLSANRQLAALTAFDAEHYFDGQSGFSSNPPEMRYSVGEDGIVPTGEVTFNIQSVTVIEHGDWSVSWSVPR